ncbi:MAG: exodeoxyribonuclease VII small subunit [Ignavibacteriales bacterium]|nr:MAG: exodeoxyribonuclease VII small subunit [Ignavibacteriales bacterium]
MKKSNKSFEDSLNRLEEISNLLDDEELGLDESIKLYEEGIELSKVCYTKLKEAELKVTTLKKNLETGSLEELSFSE